MPVSSGGWLDVVVPVKDRPEVARSVRSLLGLGPLLHAVHVCDGGTASAGGHAALAELAGRPRVRVHAHAAPGFDKPRLLNAGLAGCAAPYVLVSDADIVWSAAAVHAMRGALDAAGGRALCCIRHVRESRRGTPSLSRARYGVEVVEEEEAFVVRVRPIAPAAHLRGGPGLVMARRECWLELGGYAAGFQGWGWEDQDLLVRAKLLGMRVARAGEVHHLSHGEEARNRFHGGVDPVATRDANIVRSCLRLAAGELVGPLRRGGPACPARPVRVDLPPGLASSGNAE